MYQISDVNLNFGTLPNGRLYADIAFNVHFAPDSVYQNTHFGLYVGIYSNQSFNDGWQGSNGGYGSQNNWSNNGWNGGFGGQFGNSFGSNRQPQGLLWACRETVASNGFRTLQFSRRVMLNQYQGQWFNFNQFMQQMANTFFTQIWMVPEQVEYQGYNHVYNYSRQFNPSFSQPQFAGMHEFGYNQLFHPGFNGQREFFANQFGQFGGFGQYPGQYFGNPTSVHGFGSYGNSYFPGYSQSSFGNWGQGSNWGQGFGQGYGSSYYPTSYQWAQNGGHGYGNWGRGSNNHFNNFGSNHNFGSFGHGYGNQGYFPQYSGFNGYNSASGYNGYNGYNGGFGGDSFNQFGSQQGSGNWNGGWNSGWNSGSNGAWNQGWNGSNARTETVTYNTHQGGSARPALAVSQVTY